MANRWFTQFRYSLEKNPVDVWAKVTIGSTGACTLVAANSKGVTSITRNSAGDYTLKFQDVYYKLLDFSVMFLSTTGLGAAPVIGLKSVDVATAGTQSVEFVCTTVGAGSATDPGSGETMYICATLSNSGAL